jgi:hypothetical protein
MNVRVEGIGSDNDVEEKIFEVGREIAKSDLAPYFVGSVVKSSGAAQ